LIALAYIPTFGLKKLLHHHLLICAIRLLEDRGSIDKSDRMFEKAIAAFRAALFTKLANISDRKVQFEIATELGIPTTAINGETRFLNLDCSQLPQIHFL
jgi:hypothetical protein